MKTIKRAQARLRHRTLGVLVVSTTLLAAAATESNAGTRDTVLLPTFRVDSGINGSADILIRLFSAPSGGTALRNECITNVAVSGGRVPSLEIGSGANKCGTAACTAFSPSLGQFAAKYSDIYFTTQTFNANSGCTTAKGAGESARQSMAASMYAGYSEQAFDVRNQTIHPAGIDLPAIASGKNALTVNGRVVIKGDGTIDPSALPASSSPASTTSASAATGWTGTSGTSYTTNSVGIGVTNSTSALSVADSQARNSVSILNTNAVAPTSPSGAGNGVALFASSTQGGAIVARAENSATVDATGQGASILATSKNGTAVWASGKNGIYAKGSQMGVQATGDYIGVNAVGGLYAIKAQGSPSDGIGIFAIGSGTGYGVEAQNSTGTALTAKGIYAGDFFGKVRINGFTSIESSATGGASILDSTGFLQLGANTGTNLGMDNNSLQARNSGTATSLYLNYNGGAVKIGSPISNVMLGLPDTYVPNYGTSGTAYANSIVTKNLAVDCRTLHTAVDWTAAPIIGSFIPVRARRVTLACGAGFTALQTTCKAATPTSIALISAGGGTCEWTNLTTVELSNIQLNNTTTCCRFNSTDPKVYEYNSAAGVYSNGAPTW